MVVQSTEICRITKVIRIINQTDILSPDVGIAPNEAVAGRPSILTDFGELCSDNHANVRYRTQDLPPKLTPESIILRLGPHECLRYSVTVALTSSDSTLVGNRVEIAAP